LAQGHFRLHLGRQSRRGLPHGRGGIYERAQVLKAFPEAGQRYFASPRDVRILLFGHYRIAYLIKEGGDIDILGVFHGALDIERFNL